MILLSLLILVVVMFFPFVPFKLPVINGFKVSLKFNVNIPVDELQDGVVKPLPIASVAPVTPIEPVEPTSPRISVVINGFKLSLKFNVNIPLDAL